MTKTLGITIAVCLIAFLGVSNSFAQGQRPNAAGKPNNVWPDAVNVPTLSTQNLIAISCSTDVSVGWTENNCKYPGYYPQAGVTVIMRTYTTCASGYHGHDQSCLTNRPQASISGPLMSATDNNGQTYYTVALPGYAGYYTFESTFLTMNSGPNLPVSGINFYGKEYDTWSIVEGAVNLSTEPFVRYILDPNVNNQSPYIDFSHGNSITYMDTEVSDAVEQASVAYAQNSLQFLGYFDRAMLLRASLPDGGILDDYSVLLTGQASQWGLTTPYRVENATGTEVDMKNPILSATGQPLPGTNPFAATILTVSMADSQCFLGAFPASFSPGASGMRSTSDRSAYWYAQPMVHFDCGNTPLHRPHSIN